MLQLVARSANDGETHHWRWWHQDRRGSAITLDLEKTRCKLLCWTLHLAARIALADGNPQRELVVIKKPG